MKERFKVELLEETRDFIDKLDEKTRYKIIYNLKKSALVNDNELFKKLQDEIWEFRTIYKNLKYRLLAFWDKSDNENTVVISTHGIIKKTDKVPKQEIEKVERIRQEYFSQKKGKKK